MNQALSEGGESLERAVNVNVAECRALRDSHALTSRRGRRSRRHVSTKGPAVMMLDVGLGLPAKS